MSQTFKLYRLQQLDSQLDQAWKRVREIDRALSDNPALRQAEGNTRKAEAVLQSAKTKLRKAEQNVQAQNLKIEQTEASLYGGKVRNPKELQDLNNEAAALKRYLAVLEERQLEAMIVEEDAQASYQERSHKLESIREATLKENQQLTEEKESLEKTIVRLNGERDASVKSVPADDLEIYEQLRKQRHGIAVALVSENFCSACGSTLSAAVLYEARSPNTLTRCDTCGRILFVG